MLRILDSLFLQGLMMLNQIFFPFPISGMMIKSYLMLLCYGTTALEQGILRISGAPAWL